MKMNYNIINILFSLSLITNSLATIEDTLRYKLFQKYDKYVRPIKNISHTLPLKIGIEIRGLEEFNQKDEISIFNTWVTMMWYDEYLTWNIDDFDNLDHITINNNLIWKPDIELYNSASKAKVYNIQDKVRLQNDGYILWIRPATFSFSCPLSLKEFQTDSQTCSMIFGSWSFPENQLLITPFNYNYDIDYLKQNNIFFNNRIVNNNNNNYNYNISNNISISNQFTHNEWEIQNYDCYYISAKYMCCPNDRWSVITFDITMNRNSHKYYLTSVNILILTLVALCINIIDNRNYNRMYVLIFIPLSIIWVLISISNKLPVIGYFTKMDKILLLSFIICEICTFISGLIYVFNNSDYMNRFRFKVKNRQYNYYSSLNTGITTIISASINDILFNHIKKREKIELVPFKKRFLENKRQNRFIIIKKMIFHLDYLLQFILLITLLIGYRIIYYK